MSLSFVLFAAWFSGAALSVKQFPALAATGILTLFGSLNVAVPFLLDMFHIPADTFQLFLATSVVNARFGTLLSAVHTVAMALIGTCAAAGVVRLDPRKLLRFAVTTAMFLVATVGGTHLVAEHFAGTGYDRDKVLAGMHAIRNRGDARVYTSPAPPLPPFTGSVLDRMRARERLRVGYFDDSLPYAFTNSAGQLVGFDVEMAYQLARDLGVSLELVPVNRRLFIDGLDPSCCDLVMSGAVVTADRALRVRFSTPYLDETLAFIVADYRRSEFASWEDIAAARPLRVGVPGASYYLDTLRARLPQAQLSIFDSAAGLFEKTDPPLDALLLTAERGSAYTLLHPEYSVVVPKPQPMKVPLAYVIAGRDDALATVVDTWIDLKKKDGTIDELFAHWIQGRNAVPHQRRWSIMDDVLHWGSNGRREGLFYDPPTRYQTIPVFRFQRPSRFGPHHTSGLIQRPRPPGRIQPHCTPDFTPVRPSRCQSVLVSESTRIHERWPTLLISVGVISRKFRSGRAASPPAEEMFCSLT
jgi:ABC-type amino acid transport substrate-binding protein